MPMDLAAHIFCLSCSCSQIFGSGRGRGRGTGTGDRTGHSQIQSRQAIEDVFATYLGKIRIEDKISVSNAPKLESIRKSIIIHAIEG